MNPICSLLKKNRLTALLLASEIMAWAFFATAQLAGFPLHGREPHRLVALAILALALVFGTTAVVLLVHTAVRLAGRVSRSAAFALDQTALALMPAWLLVLDFLPGKTVLRRMTGILFSLALAGTIYLLLVLHYRLGRRTSLPAPIAGQPAAAGRWQRQKVLRLVFLASFAVYSLLLFNGVLPSQPFSGDEPHYLLVAKSIVRDGDINLYNNYLQKEYWEFYPGEISWHAYPGKKGITHRYSKHFLALPLLLVPAYWCSDQLVKIFPSLGEYSPPGKNIRILLPRATMTLLTAWLVTVFFLLAWEFTGSLRVAVYSWFVFAFSLPILPYAQLLYSEIPVALIMLLVLRGAVFKKLDSPKSLFWTAMGIALLPWFGVKYIVPAAAAFLVVMAANWKPAMKPKPDILYFFGPLFLSGVLFFAYLWYIYGTLAPAVVYFGVHKTHVLPVNEAIRFRAQDFFSTATAYFLDQRIGLFIYSPLYVLFIPGIVLWIRRFKRAWISCLLVAMATLAFHSLTHFRGGFVPPGRSLLPIMPILALAVAGALSWAKSRSAMRVLGFLAILSMLMAVLFLWQPQLFFNEGLSSDSWDKVTQAHILTHFSNAGVDFTRWVPNLVYLPEFSWLLLAIWLAAVIACTLAVLKKEPRASMERSAGGLALHLTCVLVLSVLLAFYQAFDVRLDPKHAQSGPGFIVYFQDANTYEGEGHGFWTRGNCRTEMALLAPARLERLRLELSSQVPFTAFVRMGTLTIPVRSATRGRYSTAIEIAPGQGKKWKNQRLYLLRLQVAQGFIPAHVDPQSTDRRHLGLFVRITVR